MTHTLLTMSRGDAPRLREWVEYHSWLGFDEIHIILDNPNDDSRAVLRSVDVPSKVTVEVQPAFGDYYDGLSQTERWARVREWRKAHEAHLTAAGIPVVDPQTERQHRHFIEALTKLSGTGESWVAVIDVDEFIAIPDGGKIQELTSTTQEPRLRFRNFNFDTTGHNHWQPFLPQHTARWAWEDVQAYGRGWENRVKTIARDDALLPFISVHPISAGPFDVADPAVARLHHYRTPDQGIMELPYRVEDKALADAFRVSENPAPSYADMSDIERSHAYMQPNWAD